MADQTPADPTAEPVLEVDEIQGNVLAGFNKDHQQLVALRFQDIPSARRWLQRISPEINTLAEVAHFNAAFKLRRARLGQDPAGLVATWVNIAFSFPGLAALTSNDDASGVPDEAFKEGLASRAGNLGDISPAGKADPTADWVIGGTAAVPDVLLIVASDTIGELNSSLARVLPTAADGAGAPVLIWQEQGATRPDLPGHEHFGFRDGISQPGVRGRKSSRAGDFLTPRLLASSPLAELAFSAPGQALVWPGQFVFGYPSTDGSSASTGGSVPAARLQPAWLRNGSLLVFRRLKQDVAGFNQFIAATAATLTTKPGFTGITTGQLAAAVIGRWPSGAPIERTQGNDDEALGKNALANNDFLFTVDTPAPVFTAGAGPVGAVFPAASADSLGFVCPHAAHIRKVNPRDQDSDKGNMFDTLTRRILRRGIPFGPPLANPTVDDGVERGLHFLCYQTSIVDQFELLQTDWANTSRNPVAGGVDLVIGQVPGQPRSMEFDRATGETETITATSLFVTPTGGGYFFAPSISALRDVLARQPG